MGFLGVVFTQIRDDPLARGSIHEITSDLQCPQAHRRRRTGNRTSMPVKGISIGASVATLFCLL